MTEIIQPIPARLKNVAVGGHVCGPEDLDFGQKVVHLIKYDAAGVEHSFESQVTQANKIYVIHDDFTLSSNVTIPANCVLEFDGGSISGAYTLTGSNTGINAGLVKIFNTNVTLAGTWNVAEAYPEWFGAKGDGTTDDTTALQKTISFIADMAEETLAYSGINDYLKKINLHGNRYLVSSTLNVYSNNVEKEISHIIICNGELLAASTLTGNDYMMQLGNKIHGTGLSLENVIFNCSDVCKPLFIKQTLGTHITKCYFRNMVDGVELYDSQTHETIFDGCVFSNQGHTYGNIALRIGTDTHVHNCIFTGYNKGIHCSGGANIITNNHFWSMTDSAIHIQDSSYNNIVTNNYFDGCRVVITRTYDAGVFNNNQFLDSNWGCGFLCTNHCNRASFFGNLIKFTDSNKSRLNGVDLTVDTINKILTSSTAVFTKEDVGKRTKSGIILSNFISSTQMNYVSRDGIPVNSGTYYISPTTVSIIKDDYNFTSLITGNIHVNAETDCDTPGSVVANQLENMHGSIFYRHTYKSRIIYSSSIYHSSYYGEDKYIPLGVIPSFMCPEVRLMFPARICNANDANDIYEICNVEINTDGLVRILHTPNGYSGNYAEFIFSAEY